MSTPTFSQFLQLLREDRRVHNHDSTRPGFRAMAMYHFGVWAAGIHSSLPRKIATRVYVALHRYVRNHYTIELHRTARLGRRVRIAHQGCIVIHPRAEIGDDCIIHQGVTLGAATEATFREGPVLGAHVDVGTGAVIVGHVTVGDGAHIGPNSVVTTNVPAGATVFGNPMRVLPATRQPQMPAQPVHHSDAA